MQVGRPALQFARGLIRRILDHDLGGQAAQCAYALTFALFPFLLLLVAIASFLPSVGSAGPIPPEALRRLPPEVQSILMARVQELSAQRSAGALTFAAFLTIYSSASGVATLIGAVNRAYDVREERPWYQRIFVGLLVTLAGVLLVLLPAIWAAIGAVAADALAHLGLPGAAEAVAMLRWPVMLSGAFAWLALLFRVAPEKYGRWRLITPGAIFSAVGLLVANVGLSIYVSRFSDMSAVYGTIGGFIVFLLWLYISSFVLLTGAEVNSMLEHPTEAKPKSPVRERRRPFRGFAPARQS